jgi:hypothetical protein
MGFLYKIVRYLPAKFIQVVTGMMSDRFEENKDSIAKVVQFIEEDHFIAIIREKKLDPNEALSELKKVRK